MYAVFIISKDPNSQIKIQSKSLAEDETVWQIKV